MSTEETAPKPETAPEKAPETAPPADVVVSKPAAAPATTRKTLTAEEFKAAQKGINDLVVINYPDANSTEGYFTICQGFICMWSVYYDMPSCCSMNDECTCLCCQGGRGMECFTCIAEESRKPTKSCETCIGVGRCCDMTDMEGGGFICCEESAVVIAYCCTRGAGKGKCIPGLFPEIISAVTQDLCCDYRCQIPPGKPENGRECIHPLGVSCCGSVLYGEGWGSAHPSRTGESKE